MKKAAARETSKVKVQRVKGAEENDKRAEDESCFKVDELYDEMMKIVNVV